MAEDIFRDITNNPVGFIAVVFLSLLVLTAIGSYFPMKLGFFAQIIILYLSAFFVYSATKEIQKGKPLSTLIIPVIITLILIIAALVFPEIFPTAFSIINP
ncbi:MAG: hypothetical protein QW469_01200 [Candidatus Aenigmatarchaeota archaeon]